MLVIRARPRSRCNNLPAVGTRCRSNVQQKYAWVHTLGFTMGATTLNLSTHLRPVVHPLIMSTYVVVVGSTTILRNRFICKDQIEWRKDSGSRLIYIFLRSSLFQFSLSLSSFHDLSSARVLLFQQFRRELENFLLFRITVERFTNVWSGIRWTPWLTVHLDDKGRTRPKNSLYTNP